MSEADPFEILPFDASHQEGVVSLAEELLCREYGVQADLSRDPDLLDVAAAYPPPESMFLVALRSGQVVGTAGILHASGTDCELRRLYVHGEHRREGIATALVSELLGFVKERGYRRVLLELQPHMEDTVKRYGRYGFKLVEQPAGLPRPGRFMAITFPGAG